MKLNELLKQIHPLPYSRGREYSNSQDELDGADGRTIGVIWTRNAPTGASARPQFRDDLEHRATMNYLIHAANQFPVTLEMLRVLLKHIDDSGADFGSQRACHIPIEVIKAVRLIYEPANDLDHKSNSSV